MFDDFDYNKTNHYNVVSRLNLMRISILIMPKIEKSCKNIVNHLRANEDFYFDHAKISKKSYEKRDQSI
jgi:hypothetical protein